MRDIALFELREALKAYKAKAEEQAKYSKSLFLQSRAKGEVDTADIIIDALYYLLTDRKERFNDLLLYLSKEDA